MATWTELVREARGAGLEETGVRPRYHPDDPVECLIFDHPGRDCRVYVKRMADGRVGWEYGSKRDGMGATGDALEALRKLLSGEWGLA